VLPLLLELTSLKVRPLNVKSLLVVYLGSESREVLWPLVKVCGGLQEKARPSLAVDGNGST
jgi:hypothetical protein